jgi:hypothetical protein
LSYAIVVPSCELSVFIVDSSAAAAVAAGVWRKAIEVFR